MQSNYQYYFDNMKDNKEFEKNIVEYINQLETFKKDIRSYILSSWITFNWEQIHSLDMIDSNTIYINFDDFGSAYTTTLKELLAQIKNNN